MWGWGYNFQDVFGLPGVATNTVPSPVQLPIPCKRQAGDGGRERGPGAQPVGAGGADGAWVPTLSTPTDTFPRLWLEVVLRRHHALSPSALFKPSVECRSPCTPHPHSFPLPHFSSRASGVNTCRWRSAPMAKSCWPPAGTPTVAVGVVDRPQPSSPFPTPSAVASSAWLSARRTRCCWLPTAPCGLPGERHGQLGRTTLNPEGGDSNVVQVPDIPDKVVRVAAGEST